MEGPHCLLIFVTFLTLALGKEVVESTEYPTTPYPTEYPTTWHPTDNTPPTYPTEYPTTWHPTEYPTTRYPTDYPTTWHPTDYQTTRYPTDCPTTWHPTDYPTTRYPTDYPTTRYPTEYPTTWYPTEYPTTRYPTEYPTTWYPTEWTTSQRPTESPHVCYEDGECLYSNLIDVTYPSSAEECLQHCRRTDRCQWFTYKVHGGSFCELFESCEFLSDNECTSCTTGQVSCPDQRCNILGRCEVIFKFLIKYFIRQFFCAFQGLLLHSMMSTSVGKCHQYCSDYHDCTWFSHSEATDTCLLFLTCPTIEEDHQENEYYAYHTFQASCSPN